MSSNIHREVEQVAEVQAVLTDPKKLILYGFALGLKAENPFLGIVLPSAEKQNEAVG